MVILRPLYSPWGQFLEDQLTTRQVAEALGVSESSVKRWCDGGSIPTMRTVGGHRRIPLAGFMQFLEQTNRTVTSPLAPVGGRMSESGEPTLDRSVFREALKAGDESTCREFATRAFAQKQSFAWVADEVIADTFHHFGRAWECGELEVFQERRGCEIAARLIYEMRRLIPDPPSHGLLAIGGAPAGDLYSLPSQIVEITLRECGWRATNLGSNLPLETIGAAVRQLRPRLLWLSASHLADSGRFVQQYSDFHESLPTGTLVVVGGRALNDEIRPKIRYTSHCDNMQQLAEFAKAVHGQHRVLGTSVN